MQTQTRRAQACREFEAETGLYYYRARYYDPAAGRFLNNDPLRFLPGINLYAYVRNNPTRFRDPSGKDPVIGVTVGLIAGTLQGGIGAALAGGNIKDIINGAGVGGVIGAAIGAIDPSLGVGALAIIGGASGGLGDLFGQIIAGAGTRCKPINWGSTLGAIAGGALSGGGGTLLAQGAAQLALSEGAATAAGAALASGPAIFPPAIGAKLGEPEKPGDCGCHK
jgi:RHS repeat-associated protein